MRRPNSRIYCHFLSFLVRGDAVERGRKEVEHRVHALEATIDGLNAQMRDAAQLTQEASRKRLEADFKIEKLTEALATGSTRANAAEEAAAAADARLAAAGDQLARKVGQRENRARQERTMAARVAKLAALAAEAEARAEEAERAEEKWRAKEQWLKNKLKKK